MLWFAGSGLEDSVPKPTTSPRRGDAQRSGGRECRASDRQESAEASGKVLVNGEPLPSGRIALRPKTTAQNVRTPQAVITDGKYSFSANQGISPGEYSVVITGRRKTGDNLPPEEGSGEVIQRYEQYLPAKYNTNTELTTTLVSNSSEVDFDLELPRAKQR